MKNKMFVLVKHYSKFMLDSSLSDHSLNAKQVGIGK